jgi:hypothetical protein
VQDGAVGADVIRPALREAGRVRLRGAATFFVGSLRMGKSAFSFSANALLSSGVSTLIM